jgi:hypothetical protein
MLSVASSREAIASKMVMMPWSPNLSRSRRVSAIDPGDSNIDCTCVREWRLVVRLNWFVLLSIVTTRSIFDGPIYSMMASISTDLRNSSKSF